MSTIRVALAGLCTAVMLSSGCATTGGSTSDSPSAAQTEFKPKGEISWAEGGASWDETRVMGPKINVSRRGDGSWAGEIAGNIIDVNVYPNRISGSNLTMALSKEGEKIVITGQVHAIMVRYEYDGKVLLARTGTKSVTVPRTGPNSFGDITLNGEAVSANPPEPQFALALVAAFY